MISAFAIKNSNNFFLSEKGWMPGDDFNGDVCQIAIKKNISVRS
jgi:hypothetical protein